MNLMFLVVGITSFVAGANMRVLDPLLLVIGLDFGVEATVAAAVVTSFSLAYGLFQLIYGPLSERYGKIEVMFWASMLASLMSLISSQVSTLGEFTIIRFLTGAGVGGLIPLALAWVADASTYRDRQKALAKLVAFVILGTIFGPSSSGFISDAFGWRIVFFIYFVLFLLNSAMLFMIVLKAGKRRRENNKKLHVGWGFKKQIEVLRDRWVRVVLATVFIEGALFHGCHAFVGTYLQDKFGLTMGTAGLVVAFFGFGAILYTMVVGRLIRLLGQEGLVLGGGITMFCCYFAMPLIETWQYSIFAITLSGFAFFMFHNTLQTCSSEMIPSKRGIALCLHGFSMLTGTSLGVVFIALIIKSHGYLIAYFLSGSGLLILSVIFKRCLNERNAKFKDSVEY